MKNTISFPVIVAMLFLCSGCSRVSDWVIHSFEQGDRAIYDETIPKQHIRSITVYDEFYTRGRFAVMWLSDAVRTVYTDVSAIRQGKSEEKRDSFLRRQLAENQHFIVFYVLAPYSYALNDPLGEWSIFLQIGDLYFEPIEIKAFELEPEYKAFFGKHYNRFKVAYRVKFEAKDAADGKPLLREGVSQLSMHLRSLQRNIKLDWNLKDREKETDKKA